MGNNKCEICRQQAKSQNTDGWLHVKCTRCGDFFIEPEIIEDNQDKLNDQVNIAKISGWIQENQREKIDAKKFYWLVNKLVMPNIYEKAQRLIKWLNKKTTYPGLSIPINLVQPDDYLIELLSICWAYNEKEISYLIDYLSDQGFVKKNNNINILLTITPLGFSYIEDMQKNTNSNLGFCAMWFDDEVKPVWDNAIEPAIKKAGYDPKRIDAHPHNGVVVDEIISLIRRSKFIISDLTGNRGGVYYEAGFAKGFGLEVIFTCRKDHLQYLHFDVSHYNFLIWEHEKYDEFKENLTFRIESTLGQGKK